MPCMQAAPGRPDKAAGPSKEAIVFIFRGGSYLEAQILSVWGYRTQPMSSTGPQTC